MIVELEPIEGPTESYSVRLQEDDGESTPAVIGTVERTGADTWGFRVNSISGVPASREVMLTLTAKDVAELREVIMQRFGAIDLPADRLRERTLQGFTESTLQQVARLADLTNTVPGLVRAYSTQLALLVASNFEDDAVGPFLDTFAAQVKEHVAAIRAAEATGELLAKQLRNALRRATKRDDEPTKH
jgi:hypothetical protein